jgi:hypothetical protein
MGAQVKQLISTVIVSPKRPNRKPNSPTTDRIINYLLSVSRFTKEAAVSHDPEVITTALGLLCISKRTIRQIVGGVQ